jgi:nitroreductase
MTVVPTTEDRKSLRRLAERIRSRRTTKLFLKQAVDRKLILDAIEVARWAPNHHLTEPWHFYVLGSRKIRECVDLTRTVVTEIKDAKMGKFKAESAAAIPGWLVVTCKKSDDELLQREDYASCACAIQNLMLYLSEAGVATKWATGPITRDERFYELLGADPNSVLVVGIIWYGYPKITPEQSRQEVSLIVTETD